LVGLVPAEILAEVDASNVASPINGVSVFGRFSTSNPSG
jgi:hypothetical protein